MSKVILYIATSLDGFISGPNNEIDWLENMPNPEKADFGYTDFISNIGHTIMGRKTYEEVLGFGVDWPYTEMDSYVVTSNENYDTKTERTFAVSNLNDGFINNLKSTGKDIWLIGGGVLNKHFLEQNWIDEIQLCLIPTVIGAGKTLFPDVKFNSYFDLKSSTSYPGGAVMLIYNSKK